jgi:hypothetical protein
VTLHPPIRRSPKSINRMILLDKPHDIDEFESKLTCSSWADLQWDKYQDSILIREEDFIRIAENDLTNFGLDRSTAQPYWEIEMSILAVDEVNEWLGDNPQCQHQWIDGNLFLDDLESSDLIHARFVG